MNFRSFGTFAFWVIELGIWQHWKLQMCKFLCKKGVWPPIFFHGWPLIYPELILWSSLPPEVRKTDFFAKILHICNFHHFQKLKINYSKCICSKWPEIQNLSSLDILKAIHEKKLEAKPLFCTRICIFAIFSVLKFGVQLLKMYMFQMTWNSKLKLPGYIKGHPWKKIGGQTPFLHRNLHICNFQCCQIQSAITQNAYVPNDLKFKT